MSIEISDEMYDYFKEKVRRVLTRRGKPTSETILNDELKRSFGIAEHTSVTLLRRMREEGTIIFKEYRYHLP